MRSMRTRVVFSMTRATIAAAALLAGIAVPTGWAPTALAAGPPPTAGAPPGQPACAAAPRPGMTACQLARGPVPPPGTRRAKAAVGTGTPTGYSPSQLQEAYQLPWARAGMLQTVAVVAPYDDPNAAADLAVYRANYGLPACTSADGCFAEVNQGGESIPPNPPPAGNVSWAQVTSAQLDAVSAVCPNCHILLVEVDSNAMMNVGAGVTQAHILGASVITVGASVPETSGDPGTGFDAIFAGVKGVAVTAAAGDNGYQPPGSALEYPAASQYVTAVGGTTLTKSGTGACTAALAGSRGWCESVWNGLASTSNPAGTASGCSLYEPQPSWQAGTVGTGCGGQRTSVDVAADADPVTGIAVYDSDSEGGWLTAPYGGTAVAAAIVAGVYALAGAPAGGAYPAAYPYQHLSALNDITTGNNLAPGQTACTPSYLCEAGTDYDGPTGLGSPRGPLSFSSAGGWTGLLHNGIIGPNGSMCLDDYNDGSANGNKIQIWQCLGDASQKFTMEADGTIQINGKCLAIVTPPTGDGTKTQLWQCLGGDTDQQWRPESNGELVNVGTGLCLDNYYKPSSGNGTDNGTPIDLWSCTGNPNQQWSLPYPDPVALDRITSTYPPLGTLCMDDFRGGSTSGNKVDIWTCDTGPDADTSQAWTVETNGTIQIHGICLDVSHSGTSPGTSVDLFTCDGTGAQQWQVLSNGSIVNPESGLCLDEGGTTTPGTQLKIQTCNQDAAQTWLLTSF